MLAKRAAAICCQWRESIRRFPCRAPAVVTGNPIRQEVLEERPAKVSSFAGLADGQPTVLVMGGSQGAHQINEAVPAALPRLRRTVKGLQFIHLTGSADRAEVEAAYRRAETRACVIDHLDDMAAAYGCADVVVSRAGGTSLAEITALGKPAILIPYPYAADDHQRYNARALADCGAAETIDPNQLTPDILAARLEALLLDETLRRGTAVRAREQGRPEAAEAVLATIDSVLGLEPTQEQAATPPLQTAT
jgi:UDP-N-acetylglucosamine--N-acetylmuramyl-(pentapeptide) pyrophosphoryl-undecaprenol N-acetylglucosamine transferase